MITIPTPKDEPSYTEEQRAELARAFKEALPSLISGRKNFICLALPQHGGELAGELLMRRLGVDEDGDTNTYFSWFHQVNNGVHPLNGQTLRIHWVEALIKEFE